MTQIVQEGIEPLLIGEKLLQKIPYKPGMPTVFTLIKRERPTRPVRAGSGRRTTAAAAASGRAAARASRTGGA